MQIKTKDLKKIINTVKPGLSEKQLVPGMTRFIFTGIYVVTYNGEECVHCPLETDFTCSVNADEFAKTVTQIKADELDLTLEGNQLHLKSGRIKAKFNIEANIDVVEGVIDSIMEEIGGEAADWKDIPDKFSEAIKLTAFAASTDKTKQTQCCIHMYDNFMLAGDHQLGKIGFHQLETELPPFMINAKEALSLTSGNVNMFYITNAWVHFATNDEVIFSIRKVEGDFPYDESFNTLQNFPDDSVDLVMPKDMAAAIETAGIFGSDDDFPIEVVAGNKKLVCRGTSEAGSADYEAETEYAGDEVTFRINSNLIKHMLGKTDTMMIDVKNSHAMFNADDFWYFMALKVT